MNQRPAPALGHPATADTFDLFGREVVVISDSPAVGSAVACLYERQRVGPLRRCGEPALRVRVIDGGMNGGCAVEALGRRFTVAASRQLVHLTHLVMANAAAATAPGRIVLHAGAVARDGRAIAIVGPSGWGKSTLTMELVRRGWSFLTDDFAPVTARGDVEPFPRRVGLTETSLALLGHATPTGAPPTYSSQGRLKWMVDVEELFPGSIGTSCRLDAVFVMASSRANGGGQRWRILLDRSADGLEVPLGALPGVRTIERRGATGFELRVAGTAPLLANLTMACRDREASILAADAASWSDPVFADEPRARELTLEAAFEAAADHAVTLAGRRLFGTVTPSDRMRVQTFLERSGTASGTRAYMLEPGSLMKTAALIEHLADRRPRRHRQVEGSGHRGPDPSKA